MTTSTLVIPDGIAKKLFVVVGFGVSGWAAARLLKECGAHVVINDMRNESVLFEQVKKARKRGIEVSLGGHDVELFRSADTIVVSPGVPPLEELDAAELSGVPVIGEIELASWFVSSPIVAITGTNGKSTVTSMIGAIAEETGKACFVGGNLGQPLVSVAGTDAAQPDGMVIVELSSFQLERVSRFRPTVAMVLNLTADHLDRYENFEDYVAAKANIFRNQPQDGFAVAKHGDALSESIAKTSRATLRTFGEGGQVFVEDQHIVLRHQGELLSIMAVSELKLRGAHNVDNACAAALAGHLMGASSSQIGNALRSFVGLDHRMSLVGSLDGVDYFDDSKATNVGATVAALSGFEGETGKVVLIAGGKDKGGSYLPMCEALTRVGRGVVLIGEAANAIEAALNNIAPSVPFVHATTMQTAVSKARELAQHGDTVLLAPACSSYDMYASYRARGVAFCEAVQLEVAS